MPDYMFLLESRLSPEQRAAMLRVQELAAVLGFNVYLTGGTVRDLITVISPMTTENATGTITRLCETSRDETSDRVSQAILKHPCSAAKN